MSQPTTEQRKAEVNRIEMKRAFKQFLNNYDAPDFARLRAFAAVETSPITSHPPVWVSSLVIDCPTNSGGLCPALLLASILGGCDAKGNPLIPRPKSLRSVRINQPPCNHFKYYGCEGMYEVVFTDSAYGDSVIVVDDLSTAFALWVESIGRGKTPCEIKQNMSRLAYRISQTQA